MNFNEFLKHVKEVHAGDRAVIAGKGLTKLGNPFVILQPKGQRGINSPSFHRIIFNRHHGTCSECC